MKITCYIRLEGNVVDIRTLLAEQGSHLHGEFLTRKRMTQNGVQDGATYRKSFEVESSLGTLSEDCTSFLDNLNLDLGAKDIALEVEVVAAYLSGEEPAGFFVGADLIKTLAGYGASLDIDVVPFLSKDDVNFRERGWRV